MEIMMRTTYGVEVAGERLDIERVTSRSEGSGWKSTCRDNSLDAYPTVRAVLRGRGWQQCRPATRLVGKKKEQRWLWHAVDHRSGKVLAYVLGARKDEVFLQLKALLEPFGIQRFYTDGWSAYARHLAPEGQNPGKRNTQRIERKHLNLRT